MLKEKKEIITKLLSIPRDFYAKGNLSEWALIKESGYPDKKDEISKEDIKAILEQYPSYMQDWIALSEDKYTGRGWYIEQQGKGYEVGYYTEGQRIRTTLFPNIIDACCLFIKNNTDEIVFVMKETEKK